MNATVRVLDLGDLTVVEVDAPPAATLDRGWRQRWSAAGRTAQAPWCSSGPAHASVRIPTERAGPLLALAEEIQST